MARHITDPAVVTVTAVATPVCAAYSSRSTVTVYNNSTSIIVYVGNGNVADTAGMPIPPKMERQIVTEDVLYAITASGNADVLVCEERF